MGNCASRQGLAGERVKRVKNKRAVNQGMRLETGTCRRRAQRVKKSKEQSDHRE